MSQSYLRGLSMVVSIFTVLLALVGCKDNRSEVRKAAANAVVQPVEVIPVVRRDVTETLSLVGSVAPNESARMRAEVAGLVRSIHFEEGQKVTKGQILFTIDDTELVAQTTQAQEAFKLAEINLQRSVTLLGAQILSPYCFLVLGLERLLLVRSYPALEVALNQVISSITA